MRVAGNNIPLTIPAHTVETCTFIFRRSAMTYQRDLKRLIVSLDSLTNGQASVTVDEENVCKFTLTVIPNDGLYHNGKFDFEISFDDPSSYPADVPLVICTTPIYHPNIDNDEYESTNVCVSLFDDWDSNSLADIVQGLLFLFYNPNLEDPLSSLFDGSESQDEFAERVKMSLTGELEVDGVTFARNQVTDESTPPADNNTVNTPVDTSDTQETNNTPHRTTNDDDILETNTENSPPNDTTQISTNDSNTVITQELNNTVQFSNQVSNVTAKTNATNEVKILNKQESLCATVNSEPSSPTVAVCPTLDHTDHQTWTTILGTVTILLYIGFVNCDQHFYEILR